MAVVLASVAFWAPGQYTLVGDDHMPVVVPFRARFKRLKRSERQELDRRLAAGRITATQRAEIRKLLDLPETTETERAEMRQQLEAVPISDKEFLDLLLTDWDLRDLTKTAVIYTPLERAEMFEDWDGLEAAFVESYFDAIRATKDAAQTAKNSAAPSAIPG